jgi:hypothetical protein
MTKHDGGLGLNDIYTQEKIPAATLVVRTLEGDAPWKALVTHNTSLQSLLNGSVDNLPYLTSLALPNAFRYSDHLCSSTLGRLGRQVANWLSWNRSGSNGIFLLGLSGLRNCRDSAFMIFCASRPEDWARKISSSGGIFATQMKGRKQMAGPSSH